MYYRYVNISDDQIKWKTKIYHIVGTILTSNQKRGNIDTTYTDTHACSLSWLDSRTLIKSGSVKLVLLAKMSNLFYAYFRITTTKEKNTSESPFSSSWKLLNYLALSLPHEGFSRNTPSELNLIFTFLLRWDDDDIRFVTDQYALWNINNASSLKQQFQCRHVV